MKTTKIFKTMAVAAMFLLTITSCKKEEPQPAPQPKAVLLEYSGTISGNGVTGVATYWDPYLSKLETVNIIGKTISKTFTVMEGEYVTFYITATGGSTTTVSAKAEIYSNSTKKYTDLDVNTGSANASVSGTL